MESLVLHVSYWSKFNLLFNHTIKWFQYGFLYGTKFANSIINSQQKNKSITFFFTDKGEFLLLQIQSIRKSKLARYRNESNYKYFKP